MKDLEGYIGEKYQVDFSPGQFERSTGGLLEVTVAKFTQGGVQKVGSYKRNYHAFYNTFFPFVLNGKELALYSPDCRYTRVMELPSCNDLGGEDSTNTPQSDHFCPIEFYVPVFRTGTVFFNEPTPDGRTSRTALLLGEECFEDNASEDGTDATTKPGNQIRLKSRLDPIQYCNFGFVAGYAWGDDTSLKLQYLDLSQADKGIIKRDARFGYVELPHNLKLKDSIGMRFWTPERQLIAITSTRVFNNSGEPEGTGIKSAEPQVPKDKQ